MSVTPAVEIVKQTTVSYFFSVREVGKEALNETMLGLNSLVIKLRTLALLEHYNQPLPLSI